MKLPLLFLLSAAVALAANSPTTPPSADAVKLNGAWRSIDNAMRTMIVMDGYYAQAQFDSAQRVFEGAFGGPFTLANGIVRGKVDFNSIDPSQIGSDFSLPLTLEGDRLVIGAGDEKETWTRLDTGKAALAGTWRLSGRETNGKMNEVAASPRRMLKLVSEKRYHWITFDVVTQTFVGSGGGTYTFTDGKYVENIEFFAGNASRVGMALPFTGEIKDGKWHHRGQSSAGDALYQVWTRL